MSETSGRGHIANLLDSHLNGRLTKGELVTMLLDENKQARAAAFKEAAEVVRKWETSIAAAKTAAIATEKLNRLAARLDRMAEAQEVRDEL